MARDDEFSEFAAARYGALVRVAFLLSNDRGHAEDLAQSALLKTYVAWGRLRSLQNAEAYARRTMIRLFIRSRRRHWVGEIPAGQPPDPGSRVASLAEPGEAAANAMDVRRALAGLPAGQREVLVLRYFDDRSEAETAALLGISVGTVKSRASRGLAGLRAAGLLAAEGERR